MKKISDEKFIEAYVSSHSREEVAHKTGLSPASVTDRADAIRKKQKIELPPLPRQKRREGTARLAVIRLMNAVDDDRHCAEELLRGESKSQVATRTLALLAIAGSLDEALKLVQDYKPSNVNLSDTIDLPLGEWNTDEIL